MNEQKFLEGLYRHVIAEEKIKRKKFKIPLVVSGAQRSRIHDSFLSASKLDKSMTAIVDLHTNVNSVEQHE